MKYGRLFKRAQSTNTLGKYVMVTVAVPGVEKFSPERKEVVRKQMLNLYTTLSGHPSYYGSFEGGKKMFDDYAFGLACEEQYAESLKRTVARFVKAFSFDTVMAYGRFETLQYHKEDAEYYGGHLYTLLLVAHKIFGLGKKYYIRNKGIK